MRQSVHQKYVGGAEQVVASAAANNQQHACRLCLLHAPEGQRIPTQLLSMGLLTRCGTAMVGVEALLQSPPAGAGAPDSCFL